MRLSFSRVVRVGTGLALSVLACSPNEVPFWAAPDESSDGSPNGGSAGASGASAATNGTGAFVSGSGSSGKDGAGASSNDDARAGAGGEAHSDDVGSAGAPASGGSTGSGEPPMGSGAVILRVDFQERAAGVYTSEMVGEDFGALPTWNDGLDEERARVVVQGSQRFLRVTFEGNAFGPVNGGVQFKVPLPKGYDELYLSYRVRFAQNFQFVRGGKLPGLVGGSAPTGCVSDTNGFSARGMWRSRGRAVQYVYHAGKQSQCGDDFEYELDEEPFVFQRGHWHVLEHHLVMNTPGEADGILEAWVDGEPVLVRSDIRYRPAGKNFKIDTLYFSTFFGGNDQSYAPRAAQTLDYDDFIVSTEPITH